jgi:hypothetical protein
MEKLSLEQLVMLIASVAAIVIIYYIITVGLGVAKLR